MTVSRIYELAMNMATLNWSKEQDKATKNGNPITQARADRLWEELHEIEILYRQLDESAFMPISKA